MKNGADLEQYYLTQVKPRWPESAKFFKEKLLSVLDIEGKVMVGTVCVFIVKQDGSFCVKDRKTGKSLEVNPNMKITSLGEEEFNVPVMILHSQLSHTTIGCSLELETIEMGNGIRFFVSGEIIIFISGDQVCWISLLQHLCSSNLL